MTNLLVRLFIKDPENTSAPQVRESYGVLAAFVGIVMNLLLCAAKFLVGMWSGSIAIQADAVNNLSDIGASAVTLIGFKAAMRPADKEHPFGHARVEYIAALAVSFLILLVAFELGKESVGKIIAPTPVEYHPVTMIVLAISILGKLYLGCFTRNIGKRIGSSALAASTMDSVCDVISTGAILVSTVIGYFTNLNLDGYIGILVALFVLYAGINILKDTVSPLMGEAPDPEMVRELQERLLSYHGIDGLHDIVIHNYGPGRLIATAHAEVSADCDVLEIHETIDKAEREVGEAMRMMLTLHLDPLSTNDEACNAARAQVGAAIASIDEHLSFHDFRMVPGEQQTNLIFDIVVPHGYTSAQIADVKSEIRARMIQVDPSYRCVITVDADYTGAH